MRGIMLVARVRFREYLVGVVSALATSPAVVVDVGADGNCGRYFALEIGDAGL